MLRTKVYDWLQIHAPLQSDAQPRCTFFVYLSNTSDTDIRCMYELKDVVSILSINLAFNYKRLGDVESMRAVACAHQTRP